MTADNTATCEIAGGHRPPLQIYRFDLCAKPGGSVHEGTDCLPNKDNGNDRFGGKENRWIDGKDCLLRADDRYICRKDRYSPGKTAISTEMIAKIGYVCKSLNPNDLIRPSDNRLRPEKIATFAKIIRTNVKHDSR